MIDKIKCKAIYYRMTGGKGENRQYTKECGDDLAKEITKIKNARVSMSLKIKLQQTRGWKQSV